ncbi:MAG: DUF502 domain-containing protein [Gammaproteobacteria bacterium]|nr:MAG: DUF502 domain-containing protein [Gammaproteobacteria bacterium]
MGHFRRYLIAGLLVWVPVGITWFVIKFMIDLMDQTLLLLPPDFRPENLLGFRVPGVGVLLTIVILLVTGVVAANLIGRKLVQLGERLLARIPLVRSIYSGVKQVMETMFSDSGKSFRSVVLIEYPRKEIWTLAFLTGDRGTSEVENKTGKPLSHVFVPTTPNPTSGFFLMVPTDDVVVLDLSVDEGLKMIISAGVVVPPEKKEELMARRSGAA